MLVSWTRTSSLGDEFEADEAEWGGGGGDARRGGRPTTKRSISARNSVGLTNQKLSTALLPHSAADTQRDRRQPDRVSRTPQTLQKCLAAILKPWRAG